MLKTAIARAATMAGAILLYALAIVKLLLDWIGRSTAGDDASQLLNEKLPAWAEWLFSTPSWAPALCAFLLTAWLIWLSWPPRIAPGPPAAKGDAELRPVDHHASAFERISSSEGRLPALAADEQSQRVEALVTSRLEPRFVYVARQMRSAASAIRDRDKYAALSESFVDFYADRVTSSSSMRIGFVLGCARHGDRVLIRELSDSLFEYIDTYLRNVWLWHNLCVACGQSLEATSGYPQWVSAHRALRDELAGFVAANTWIGKCHSLSSGTWDDPFSTP